LLKPIELDARIAQARDLDHGALAQR